MAGLVQLDKAAAMVGKSEVTLRRLVKSGKIPFQKEKTLTGFIYLVDAEKVKSFYQARGAQINEAIAEEEAAPEQVVTVHNARPTATAVRVAIAGEDGSPSDYWQKKSELYEDRYHQEVSKHAQTREELGVWRGRAEQSQAMLIKLLPTPQEVEVSQQEQSGRRPEVVHKDQSGVWTTIVILLMLIVLAGAVGVVAYLKLV